METKGSDALINLSSDFIFWAAYLEKSVGDGLHQDYFGSRSLLS
jgi:hypothetical protein